MTRSTLLNNDNSLQEHRQQMSEAVENLNAVHEAHKREIAQLHGSANQQGTYTLYII